MNKEIVEMYQKAWLAALWTWQAAGIREEKEDLRQAEAEAWRLYRAVKEKGENDEPSN